jgi:hypothetical protein
MKRPNTIWYDQGRLARKLGKDKSECPYKEGTYGYAQWILGYTEELLKYAE